MELLRILHLVWGQLVSRTTQELKLFTLIGIFFISGVYFKPYEDTSDKIKQDSPTLERRLGYSILLNSGYFKARSSREQRSYQSLFESRLANHSDLTCLDDKSPHFPISNEEALDVIDIENLIISLVAAEKYNRNSIHRKLEIQLARIALKLTGSLPDFSYGVSQIKPDNARKILASELDGELVQDTTLFEILRNDCQNIRLSAQYIEQILKKFSDSMSTEEIIEAVALEYNGATAESFNGLRYIDAVKGSYNILRSERRARDSGESIVLDKFNPVYMGCVNFPIGTISPVGSINWSIDKSKEINLSDLKLANVYIFSPQNDPSLENYSTLLTNKRKEWFTKKLSTYNLAEDKMIFLEQSAYSLKFIQEHCSEHGTLIIAADIN